MENRAVEIQIKASNDSPTMGQRRLVSPGGTIVNQRADPASINIGGPTTHAVRFL